MKLHPRDVPGVIAASAATVIGLALMVSGSSVAPSAGPALSARTRAMDLDASTQELLVASLEHELGTHENPSVPEVWHAVFEDEGSTTELAERLAAGRRSYTLNCQHCHGVRGDAETQTAKILMPRPRDFSLGFTKFKQTPGTGAPLREDLHRVLEHGIASTAMADFAHLDEQERIQLTDYVQYLLMRGAVETRVAGALQTLAAADAQTAPEPAEIEFRVLEGMRVAMDAIATEWQNAPRLRFEQTPAAETPESIARGKALYLGAKANCAQCHGRDGKGRGPGAWDADFGWILHDVWGNPTRPADFTYGSYHGGGKPEEIYRSIALGVAGTAMAGYAGVLEPGEISDLTHYLRSLSEQ